MRHQKSTKKFHREKGQRQALFKILLVNLIAKEKIETSEAKAKAIKSKAEKLVTIAKKQNLSAMRILISRSSTKSAQKLYHEIAPRYKERKGGYLRIIKGAGNRKNDGSQLAIIEFV